MTTFNLTYLISMSAGLMAGYLVNSANPYASKVVAFFIVPLIVAYFVLIMINSLAPWINQYGYNLRSYVEDKSLGAVAGMGYIEIFPPLFAIFIVFIILLYAGNLGY